MFDHILNWKLLSGSHKFPGPDGGTCINEAAIVAAGFKYKEVKSADDCPPCFSRVIGAYALRLNDSMPDDLREELLTPFVVRLAGTADSPAKELERATYIAVQTIKRILPISLRAVGLEDHARRCEQVDDLAAAYAADAAAKAAYAAEAAAAKAAYAAAYAAAKAAADAADAADARKKIFSIAVAILDEAIRLGNQAEPIETALVVERMETMKRRALEHAI